MHESFATEYPVLYILLEPKDFGYAQGYRYMVEQMDSPKTDDRHFFKDAIDKHGQVTKSAEQRALEFMTLHGMRVITRDEMMTCRRELNIA